MLLQQFYLKCLAHASYVVADEQSKHAVVIDPQRDVEQYLAFAAEHGLTIGHVVLTHLHADFLAGHLELRDRAIPSIERRAHRGDAGQKVAALITKRAGLGASEPLKRLDEVQLQRVNGSGLAPDATVSRCRRARSGSALQGGTFSRRLRRSCCRHQQKS